MDTGMEVVESWKTAHCGGSNKRPGYEQATNIFHGYRDAGLTYSILAATSFGTYTVIPLFFPRFKGTVEVICPNAVEYRMQFTLDVRHCFKMPPLQFHFQFGKQIEITGGKTGE
jgi:hypothetical protein